MLSHWTPKSRTPFTAPKRNWALERKEERSSKVKQMYNWAVAMSYDAMILGNHDFDEGIDLLEYFSDDANNNPPHKLPFICANLEYPNDSPFFLGKKGLVPTYKVIAKSGVEIGVIGISEQANGDGDKAPNKDYHFPSTNDKNKLKTHPVNSEYIKVVISEVQKKSDFIVVLSHNRDYIDEKYTATLPIDKPLIIIGGHSHNVIPEKNKLTLPVDCYLIKSGLEGEYIGTTAITWNLVRRKIVKVKVENVLM